jgi:hypothetical protein
MVLCDVCNGGRAIGLAREGAFGDVRTYADITDGRKNAVWDRSLCTTAHWRVMLGLAENGLNRINGGI